MSTESPNETPAPTPTQRPDIYARIMRFAPLYVVVFCIGVLVLVAFVRPFKSPEPAIELRDALVGAEFNPTGAYMTIHNSGGSDTLVSASTPAATSVQLQEVAKSDTTTSTTSTASIGGTPSNTGGTLTDVDRLDIPGFDDLRLQPGSSQLLLKGLAEPLTPGQTITLTLLFERAGSITVEAAVASYDEIADRLLPPRLKLPAGQ